MNTLAKTVVACTVTATLLAGCTGRTNFNNNNSNAVPVTVLTLQPVDLTWSRTYNGSLAGVRQADLVAKIAETVVAIRVAEGHRVQPGQVILEFDKYGPSSRLRQAQAAYLDAKASYEKYERLFAGGAVSQRERDFYETQYTIAQADYEAARDLVFIKSPIAGVVTDVHVKVGQQTYLGQTLAVVADIDTMRLSFDLPYFDARSIRKNASVHIRSELDTTVTATGWVEEIAESADPVTRTVTVDVLTANPGDFLRPGMYVSGEVLLREFPQALAVPREALVTRGGTRGVFVVADSLAAFRSVAEGMTIGAVTEITKGLQAGERVVTVGQQSLLDGTRVMAEEAKPR